MISVKTTIPQIKHEDILNGYSYLTILTGITNTTDILQGDLELAHLIAHQVELIRQK